VQTQFILQKMDEVGSKDGADWASVMDSLDLLFAKVGEIDANQRKMEDRFDVSAKVMEQMLMDQQTLAKQMEATGQAVDKLTINHMGSRQEEP
jgi:hypothetical protein